MRILFITPQLPFPPHQGTQIRNYHLLRAAASAGHQVDLISFLRPGESLHRAAPLQELCGQIMVLPAPVRSRLERLQTTLTSAQPNIAFRLRSEGFAGIVRAVANGNRYDIIQLAGLEMARYLPIARIAAPRAHLVFDDHNAEYRLQYRAAAVDARRSGSWPKALYSLVQYLKLRRYEAWACQTADAVLAVSEADAEALRDLTPGIRLWVVPNGVDSEFYRPDSSIEPEPTGLLFTGTMDYRPNVDAMEWFVSTILPNITNQRSDVSLEIVGRSPTPSVLQLAALGQKVTVTGAVEDIRPYFSRNSVFVVPIRMAGGARLKILEAMAMGLPVVSTRLGAEGIDLVEDKEVLMANSPEEFASDVLRLLEDGNLRRQMATLGRQAAEERFDWGKVAPRLLEAYQLDPLVLSEAQNDRRRGPCGTPPAQLPLAEGKAPRSQIDHRPGA